MNRARLSRVPTQAHLCSLTAEDKICGVVSTELAANELGFRARVSLLDGMRGLPCFGQEQGEDAVRRENQGDQS